MKMLHKIEKKTKNSIKRMKICFKNKDKFSTKLEIFTILMGYSFFIILYPVQTVRLSILLQSSLLGLWSNHTGHKTELYGLVLYCSLVDILSLTDTIILTFILYCCYWFSNSHKYFQYGNSNGVLWSEHGFFGGC